MSKGNSGFFSGTKGNDAVSGSGTSDKATSSPYKATQALRDHIENPEPSSSVSDGIKGAHHKENFLKEVDRIGAKTTGTTPNTQVDGVEQISYKMPKKDKYVNPTGEYSFRQQGEFHIGAACEAHGPDAGPVRSVNNSYIAFAGRILYNYHIKRKGS